MPQYKSKYTGEEIDSAVAYFKEMGPGRTGIAVSVTVGNWTPYQSTPKIANYVLAVTLTGVNSVSSVKFEYPPQVYFLDEDGIKWDLQYSWTPGSSSASQDNVVCYSNQKIAGSVVIVGVLATASSAATDDNDDEDPEFWN